MSVSKFSKIDVANREQELAKQKMHPEIKKRLDGLEPYVRYFVFNNRILMTSDGLRMTYYNAENEVSLKWIFKSDTDDADQFFQRMFVILQGVIASYEGVARTLSERGEVLVKY